MTDSTPPRPAHHPPGYDEQDPYEGEDLDTYPEWWRENIEEFLQYDMRPYRPPRFADGELPPEVIADLEEELGVTIRVRSIDPHTGNDWMIWLDGEPVESVRRTREADGFSRYDIDAEEFEAIVRRAVR
jgi:hypothetical protein